MSESRLLSDEQLQAIRAGADTHSARLYGVPRLLDHIEALAGERNQLLDMTTRLSEHPDGYEGPCLCGECARGDDMEGR